MFTPDLFNNVNRRCSLPGDTVNRTWQVRRAMVTKRLGRAYLLRNVVDGRWRVAMQREMHNLY